MSYQIDASLQQGIPSLRLIDARSGEERLFWQQPETTDDKEMRYAWRALFRRLVLLASGDHLVQEREHRAARRHDGFFSREARPAQLHELPEQQQSNVVYLPVRRSGAAR